MFLSEIIHVMILTHDTFKRFAIPPILDVRATGNEGSSAYQPIADPRSTAS